MIVTVERPPHVDSACVDEREPDTPSAVDSADIAELELETLGVGSTVLSVTKVLTEEMETAALAVTKAVEVSLAKVTVSVLENPPPTDVEELELSAGLVEVVVEMVIVTVADEVEVVVESVVHVVELNDLIVTEWLVNSLPYWT